MAMYERYGLSDCDRRNPPPGAWIPAALQTGLGYRPEPTDTRQWWRRTLETAHRDAAAALEDAAVARRLASEHARQITDMKADLAELAEELIRQQNRLAPPNGGRFRQ